MNGSRQLLPAGAGERDMDTAHFLEGSTLLSLQFNVGGSGGKPLWEGKAPLNIHLGAGCRCGGLTQLFRTRSHPQTPWSIVHVSTASAEGGWGGSVQCWLSLMVAVPGEPLELMAPRLQSPSLG